VANISQAAPLLGSESETGSNTTPLVIVTVLFFMWGLITALNDVLIPHLKALYSLTYVQAMLVQFCFFGAYFVVSVPAGALVRRIGYKRGAVAGLLIAAVGCALFYPASMSGYALFLLAFFVLPTSRCWATRRRHRAVSRSRRPSIRLAPRSRRRWEAWSSCPAAS